MKIIFALYLIIKFVDCISNNYKIISATAWITENPDFYPDFASSLIPKDFRPLVFQYFYNRSSVSFTCTTRTCEQVSMIRMPGLSAAQLAHGGVPPRRILQQSPRMINTQYLLSIGHATPNHNIELVICGAEDLSCSTPHIMNMADSYGFGEGGLRLAFTKARALPMMLIPQARYASVDNRVTGYTLEACQDPLCTLGRSREALPFNLTGNANCEATSVDVAMNQFGFPSWLTLCDEELNLIHCLTDKCNETFVNQFKVDRDFVYFVYLAVDSQFRFTIAANGQTANSSITYIRCLNPNCTENTQSQLVVPDITRFSNVRTQVVINPLTDLPVFHLNAYKNSSKIPTCIFIACQDIECDISKAIFIDYGNHFGLGSPRISEIFVDDQGTVIASLYAKYLPTNDTINAVVRMAQSSEAGVDTFTFVKPTISVK